MIENKGIGADVEILGKMTNLRFPTNYQMANQLRHIVHDKLIDFWRVAPNHRDIKYIVDVGANMGAISLMFHIAFPDADILALEPSRVNYEYLKYNTEQFPQIAPVCVGAFSQPGFMSLALPSAEQREQVDPNNLGLLSLYGDGGHQEAVEVDTLDNIVSRPVDLLKLDVEGAELDVLHGASRVMAEDRPIVLMEFHDDNLKLAGRRKEDYKKFFVDAQYRSIGTYFADVILGPREDHRD